MEYLRNEWAIQRWFVMCLAGLLLGPGVLWARSGPILSHMDIFHPVYAKNGMVVSQKAEATRIGAEILARGGNAVDAAVAVGFALAVCLPRAGNLGGGGFMLIHLAEEGETLALDYRETAPALADRSAYLDAEGSVDNAKVQFSHLAVGVPGTVAGLAEALERYGTMSLADVLEPAIRLARDGLVISPEMVDAFRSKYAIFSAWPETMKIFYRADGKAFEPGERLVQKDLTWSLEQIAKNGPDAFYRGAIAKKLVSEMERHGGWIRAEDLGAYRPVWRQPVRGMYRGYEIVSMPPPSSGGVHLIQMLNLLEAYPLGFLGHNSAETLHVMVESMKLAYADRAEHLGDPDFVTVPVSGLVSKEYARELRGGIDRYRARPANEISAGVPAPYESPDTTHFSVMDRFGNAVANTYTLNFSYGTGIVAAGTGILLNNEMDDFSVLPGVPNAYGLVGGKANAVEAGKRPLSSMTPTMVLSKGRPYLVTGSPGGSRIITTTLQVIVNVLDHGMNIAAATNMPRIHHQWLPDELRVESGISPDTLQLLTARGHRVQLRSSMGSTQSILRTDRGYFGAADPRRPDALAEGH